MRSRILLSVLLTMLFVLANGCGTTTGCPVCGTTVAGQYGVIDIIPVPEHNPTGEPGGPFNSFDISWVDPVNHRFFVSDRIGLAIPVFDTINHVAMTAIQGTNAVTAAGFQASPCVQDAAGNDIIPPIVSVFGNFTRFGCRTDLSLVGGPKFHLISGFGANHQFGGFPGAQCCASRANGVNPMSGPDGLEVTPDGKYLIVANGSGSVVVFDLTTMDFSRNPPTPPTVIAAFPVGVSADYDGPLGIAPCVASWNGLAGSAADCGDDRADEMSFDPTHQLLGIINGDPGLPFTTIVDMSHIVNKSGTVAQQHCLPIDATSAYGPYAAASQGIAPYPSEGSTTTWVIPQAGASFNPPSCIVGQIYYDGAGGSASGGVGLAANVPVDNVGGTFPCPDPSNPQTFGGVSGSAAASLIPGIGTTPSGVSYTIPCHHAPLLDYTTGAFCNQTAPGANCAGAIAPAGLAGVVWNPNTGHLLQANPNAIATTNVGSIDEIDPRLGNPNGPVVINSFTILNCMPSGVVHGPGNEFLVTCADHDGEAFPPSEYIIDGTTGQQLAFFNQVGGVDEAWYNPGDGRYYLAARDMPNGPVMGVIDAKSHQWLVNVTTNSNSHSIAVEPSNNNAYVPLQAGGICGTQSSNGCVGVYAQQ
jgi:hypothetical protein